MDLSVSILEDMFRPRSNIMSTLNEQELSILNEGFGDFFRSIKDMAVDKMQKLISAKYTQLERFQKQNNAKLKQNRIDTDKISTIVNGVVVGYKSKIESAGKRKDGKSLQQIISNIGEAVKERLDGKKENWFNIKYWDPTAFLHPLAVSIIIITLKAILLAMMLFLFPLGSMALTAVIFQLLAIFIILPMIEEAGKLYSIKNDVGGAYTVIFNVADFSVMFATKFIVGGFSNMIVFIVMRLVAAAAHAGTYYIQKMGHLTDASDASFRIAWMVNGARNFVEIMLIYLGSL